MGQTCTRPQIAALASKHKIKLPAHLTEPLESLPLSLAGLSLAKTASTPAEPKDNPKAAALRQASMPVELLQVEEFTFDHSARNRDKRMRNFGKDATPDNPQFSRFN